VSTPSGEPSVDDLRERRRAIAEQVAELTFDLGGLTAELVTQGRLQHDVLVRRAAELRAADAELGELQRLVASAEGIAGSCRRCSATHARGSLYCWRCGESLAYAVPPAEGPAVQ
jgi:hypothetical protein